MPESDFDQPPVEPGAAPPGGAPPVITPRLPPALPKRGLSPWAIVAICVGGLVMVCMIGLVTLGWLVAAKYREQKTAQFRTTRVTPQQRSGRAITFEPRKAEADAGASYTNAMIPSVPWSIHIVSIDRSRDDLGFYSAHARGKVLGVSLIAEQARAVPRDLGRAIAGVNGDFYVRDNYYYAGDPRGLQIVNGELISAPDTLSVSFDAEGNPHLDEVKADFNVTWPDGRKTGFGLNEQRERRRAVLYTPTYDTSTRAAGGRELVLERDGDGPWLPLQAGEAYRARVRAVRTEGNTRIAAGTMVLSLAPDLLASVPGVAPGAVLQISTATSPDLKGVGAAIGGGPALIKDGQAFSQRMRPPGSLSDYSERSKYERHPRSAVGWSPTHVYLVTVDGRQPGLSVGMTLAELAAFMAELGCTDAMNFDGGKSAQLWWNGRTANSPCQGEDTVANSLLVIRKPTGR